MPFFPLETPIGIGIFIDGPVFRTEFSSTLGGVKLVFFP